MSAVLTIVGYGFREAVRRKVFAVVVLLTAAFLVLFWLANHYVFTRLSTITPPADVNVDTRTFAGAIPTILKVNSSNSLARPPLPRRAPTAREG